MWGDKRVEIREGMVIHRCYNRVDCIGTIVRHHKNGVEDSGGEKIGGNKITDQT